MKQNTEQKPTAHIAINKSRLKQYNKNTNLPVYYLEKSSEFQIELFNPTSDVLLAKIILNGKSISQGGLVLNPGQRVFLDRYFDVAKKFLFDTYEVSNTSEVKKAIENNGDIKIEFYREISTIPFIPSQQTWTTYGTPLNDRFYSQNTTGNITTGNIRTTGFASASATSSIDSNACFTSSATLDMGKNLEEPTLMKRRFKTSKIIETGRVEKGSYSDQKLRTVNKEFEIFAFHTVEYKMLPVSQKVNTMGDINVKRYCTNCGSKLGKTDKFCSNCGTKA